MPPPALKLKTQLKGLCHPLNFFIAAAATHPSAKLAAIHDALVAVSGSGARADVIYNTFLPNDTYLNVIYEIEGEL
jgi:hypothetical protein